MYAATVDDWYRTPDGWREQTMFAKLAIAARARGNRFAFTWGGWISTEDGWADR